MGLLDDAIREHLELKRRHGADESEVSRLATEVFGESPASAPEEEPAAPSEPREEPAAPSELREEPLAAVADEPPAVADEPPAVAEDPEPPHGDVLADEPPAPRAAAPEPAAFTADEPWLDEPDEVPSGERLDHPRSQPTTEFTPEEHAAARGEDPYVDPDTAGYVAPDEGPAEDLLEETPEFLQETPEHDRLWFEQRPPRDFDFGG